MELFRSDRNIDFVRMMPKAISVSAAAVLLSLALIAVRGFNWGLDFAGGTLVQLRAPAPLELDAIPGLVRSAGFGDAGIQTFPEKPDEVLLKFGPASGAGREADRLGAAVTEAFGAGTTLLKLEQVGPKVGSELRERGILASLAAIGGILAYLSLRFRPDQAVAAVVALAHDATVTLGLFSLIQHEVNLETLAALLTIVGYSVNDTIVIFDRIRERETRRRHADVAMLVNQSINETLSRTILTSGTTMLAVIPLMLLTSGAVHDFALAIAFGIVVGTYSTIFVATPLIVLWRTGALGALRLPPALAARASAAR